MTRVSRRLLTVIALSLGALVAAPSALAADYLFVGTSGSGNSTIGRANIDGSAYNPDFITGQICTCFLAAADGTLYWSDSPPNNGAATIRRAAYDGTGIATVATATGPARYLSVGEGLFAFTSSPQGGSQGPTAAVLSTLKQDGTDQQARFTGPVGSTINYNVIAGGKIYWAYKDGSATSIARANLDGTGVETNFIPLSQTTDVGPLTANSTHLFWGEIGATQTIVIGSAKLDGTDVKTQLITQAGAQIGAMTASDEYLYWVWGPPMQVAQSGGDDYVARAKVDGTDLQDRIITSSRQLFGIAVESASAPDPTPTVKVGPSLRLTKATSTLKVDCGSEEGMPLASCAVTLRARSGLQDGPAGVNVRAGKKTVVIGRATATATGEKAKLTVRVALNATGRRMLKQNIQLPAEVAIVVTTTRGKTGEGTATTQLALPTHTITPKTGTFDTLSTELNAKGRAFVRRLVQLLPKNPKRIVCTGYADNTGVPGDNRWLGARRAEALCDALKARGVAAARTRIVTKGATSPRDDNATAKGRERNRRAIVTITY